jgi:hypothetical protein
MLLLHHLMLQLLVPVLLLLHQLMLLLLQLPLPKLKRNRLNMHQMVVRLL